MKRLATSILGLLLLAWTSGCCCCQQNSGCVDWNDGCQAESCGNGNGCNNCSGGKHRWFQSSKNNCRNCGCGCAGAGCDSCCNRKGMGGIPQGGMMSSAGGYDAGVPVGSAGCSTCDQGAPPVNGVPMSGGCASGNCGSTAPMYSGMPIDQSAGWTIQPVPSPTAADGGASPAAGSSSSPAASNLQSSTNGATLQPVAMPTWSVPTSRPAR